MGLVAVAPSPWPIVALAEPPPRCADADPPPPPLAVLLLAALGLAPRAVQIERDHVQVHSTSGAQAGEAHGHASGFALRVEEGLLGTPLGPGRRRQSMLSWARHDDPFRMIRSFRCTSHALHLAGAEAKACTHGRSPTHGQSWNSIR
eukprot:5171779-Prymnesium_polylepis.2